VVRESQKSVNMVPQEDLIVEIPENRLKFFGGAGKMLLPSPATAAALIKKIPEHKLITTGLLCKELTQRFKVRGTCPGRWPIGECFTKTTFVAQNR
jgi:hypothetical protein